MGRPAATLSGQLLAATAWNAVLLPVRVLVALAASVVYYRLLSLEQVGLLFLITSLAATLGLHADLGMEKALPRYLPEVEERAGRHGVYDLLRRVIGLKLLVLALLMLALLALDGPLRGLLASRERAEAARIDERAAALARQAPHPQGDAAALARQAAAKRELAALIEGWGKTPLAAVGTLLLCGALYDVPMKLLSALFRQRSWNLITIAVTLLQPLLVTAFILAGRGVGGVLLGLVITAVLAVALAWRQARRVAAALPQRAGAPDPALFARFRKFALVSYVIQVGSWLTSVDCVVFLSAALLGLEQVALLGFAAKFARDSLNYVWTPFSGITTPALARIHQRGDAAAFQEAQLGLTRMVWLLVFPAGVGLLLLSAGLIETLYPGYLPARHAALVFLVAAFAEALLSVTHATLLVVERYGSLLGARLLGLAGFPLAYLLFPRLGSIGIALGIGAARLAAAALPFLLARRSLGMRLPVAFLARVVTASAVLAAVVAPLAWTLSPTQAPAGPLAIALALGRLLALAGLGAAVYVIALRRLGGMEEDRRRLAELPMPLAGTLARWL
jgi:O-antigen/teichoic acid export membrane protein